MNLSWLFKMAHMWFCAWANALGFSLVHFRSVFAFLTRMALIQLTSIIGRCLCVQQYGRTLRNIDSKEICSLLAVVFLVLEINKLVDSQEMGLGIYHYSCIHVQEARFSVSHQSWSPWNDANRYQLRPWPKDCEKPQIYYFPWNRKHKCYVAMEVVS